LLQLYTKMAVCLELAYVEAALTLSATEWCSTH